ncbi:MAG: DinB family protein [Haliscomenobacter sp.]|nr:DinB family protein [Haliscomenobacter sp.]
MSPNLEVLRYPVGKFIMPTEFSPEQLDHWIADIDHFASAVRHGVEGLSDHQIDIPYREGGWSIRQLVHHLADSHMQAFLRTRWVLTEDMPTIKPYDQDAWSNLVDNKTAPMEWSLLILEGAQALGVVASPGGGLEPVLHPSGIPSPVPPGPDAGPLPLAWKPPFGANYRVARAHGVVKGILLDILGTRPSRFAKRRQEN